MSNTPLIAQTKIIEPMVFVDYPKQVIAFFLGFGMVMQYFYKYIMEPKRFLIYANRGIACALSSDFGHEQYPLDNLLQNNYAHGVYKIPS
jgi:hypothetical protein